MAGGSIGLYDARTEPPASSHPRAPAMTFRLSTQPKASAGPRGGAEAIQKHDWVGIQESHLTSRLASWGYLPHQDLG